MELRQERPPYVIFERKPVEDRNASISQGRYMTRDVDFAIITPIGSKDRIPKQVDDWFKELEVMVREERMPAAWLEQWKQAYAAWRRGEELPVNGTPIKGWQMLSPAQQSNVISANILTVEDLAQATAEATQRIGMGALELKEKATSWLKASSGPGVLASENAALKGENARLKGQVKGLEDQLREAHGELKLLRDRGAAIELKELTS